MNLIFEGCDCTGKSTLIRFLIRNSDRFYKLFHFQRPPEEMPASEVRLFQKNMFFMHAQYLIHDEDVIFDRYHIGELVYGKFYRKYDIDYIEELENLIIDRCILVCVHCDAKEIEKRFDNRGMPIYDLEKINKFFLEHCKQSKLKKIFLDTTGKSPKQSFEELKISIQKITHTNNIIKPNSPKMDTGQYVAEETSK